jgi:hypothetical protein
LKLSAEAGVVNDILNSNSYGITVGKCGDLLITSVSVKPPLEKAATN